MNEGRYLKQYGLFSFGHGIDYFCFIHLFAGIKYFASHGRSLQVLHLGKCDFISDRGVKAVREACQQLKFMNLTYVLCIAKLSVTSHAAEYPSVQFASHSQKKTHEIMKTSKLQRCSGLYPTYALEALRELIFK